MIFCPQHVRKTEKPLIISGFCRGGRIRTYDLHIPNVARYRATLHPDFPGGCAKVKTKSESANYFTFYFKIK